MSLVEPNETELMVTAAGLTLPGYSIYTIPFFRSYCKRHGYRFSLIDSRPKDRKRHASWQKLLAYRFAHESTRQVVLVDLDVLCLPWANPIHEVLSTDKVTIMRTEGQYRKGFAFQCGVWGVPIKHRGWLEGIYETNGWWTSGYWYEQKFVSDSIRSGDVPVSNLDRKWNWIAGRRISRRVLKRIRQTGVEFVHCAGNRCAKRKHRKLKTLHDHWVHMT